MVRYFIENIANIKLIKLQTMSYYSILQYNADKNANEIAPKTCKSAALISREV